MRSVPVNWGRWGTDLGRLIGSRGMVNERHAVRWGIPSQLIQWLGRLQVVAWWVRRGQWDRRRRWIPQWPQGRRIPRPFVGIEQAPLKWGVIHEQASLDWWPVHGQAAFHWWPVHERREALVGGERTSCVRYIPGAFRFRPLVGVVPIVVSQAGSGWFWFVQAGSRLTAQWLGRRSRPAR
jgi:hypothetical protein